MQDIRSYLSLLLRGYARLSVAFNNLPDIDVKDALYRSENNGRKKWKEKNILSFSLVSNDFSSLVAFLHAPRKNDLIGPRAISYLGPRSEPILNCLRVLVTRDIYIYLFIIMSSRFDLSCLLLSRSILLSFSLAVILAVILRLPTRVSRPLSRVRARNETTVRKPLSKF